MVYVRKRSKSGKYYYKRRRNIFYRRGGNKALRLAKLALSKMNVEYKILNFQQTLANISSDSPTITNVSVMSQGDTNSTREGDQVKFTRMYARGNVFWNSTAGGVQTVRILVVVDKQTNGNQFTLPILLTDATVGDALISPLNLQNKFRFTILKDIRLNLSEQRPVMSYKIWIPKMAYKVRYGGNAGTVADQNSYSISVVYVSNIPAASNPPTITDFVRMRFVDN